MPDRLRSTLGKTELSQHCIKLIDISVTTLKDGHFDVAATATATADEPRSPLDSSLYEAQTELLRVLGNLCIDDDVNRTALLEEKGWKSIVDLLAMILEHSNGRAPTFSMQVLTLLRSATGALLNMQLDHSETRLAMRRDISAVRTLLALATSQAVYVPGEWIEEKLLRDRVPGGWQGAGAVDVKPESEEEEEMKVMTKMGASIVTWAWRILQDICTSEEQDNKGSPDAETTDDAATTAGHGQSHGHGHGQDPQDRVDTPSTRQGSDSDSEKPIEALVAAGAAHLLYLPLLSFLPSAAELGQEAKTGDEPESDLTARWYADDVSDLIDYDIDIVQLASELMESAALDSTSFREEALSSKSHPRLTSSDDRRMRTGRSPARWNCALEAMMAILDEAEPPREWSTESLSSGHSGPPPPSEPESAQEASSTFLRTKAAMARAIVAVSGEDANMAKLFGKGEQGGKSWFIETLKRWMARNVSERDDLVSTAMLSMGNLARTDDHCLALVQDHGLVPPLTQLITPDADIKVAHGVVSLLKNLSIPAANKVVIGSENKAVTLVAPYLGPAKDHVQPLQFATVGLLKHLCSGCTENSLKFVAESTTGSKDSVLDSLLDLVQRTDDVPTKMEGTRILVNAIKTLWSSKEDARSSITAHTKLRARSRLVSAGVAGALCEMVRNSPKYPVLVNEGIMSLALLGSEGSKGSRLVARALLADPTEGVLDDEPEALASGEQGAVASSPAKSLTSPATTQGRKPPSRRPTNDSLASKSSQPPPPPPYCADMVSNVLARRDARMPPQFASNACSLIYGLVEAGKRSSTSSTSTSAATTTAAAVASGRDQDDPLRKLLSVLRPSLIHLADQGPQESLESAQRALKAVDGALSSRV